MSEKAGILLVPISPQRGLFLCLFNLYVVMISLKEYIDTRLNEIEKAILLANNSLEIRLTSMNEFRNALKDQAQTLITRNEWTTAHEMLVKDVQSLKESRAGMEAKASQFSFTITLITSIVGFILSIVSLVILFYKV